MIDDKRNRAELGMSLTLLAAAHGREATPEMIAAYWSALEDMELEDVQAAMRKLARTADRMPSAPQVRAAARSVRADRVQAERTLPEAPIKPWTAEQKAEARALMGRLQRQLNASGTSSHPDDNRARAALERLTRELAARGGHGMAGGLGTEEVEG